MSRFKCYRGDINIFYFFIVALSIHLLLFLTREYNIKGDGNLQMRSAGAPISVHFKSATLKKPRPSAPSVKKEMVPPEPVPVEKKKVKEDFKSKIKDKNKEKKIKKKKDITPQEKKVTPDKTKEKSENEILNANPNVLSDDIPTDPDSNQDFLSGNFSVGTDGSFIASSSEGIEYQIITQKEPLYPQQAKKIRYSKVVVVKVKFLVGLNGDIEDIKIIKSHSKLGFDKAVTDALREWKFNPIFYKNKNIKVYFTKSFIFENIE